MHGAASATMAPPGLATPQAPAPAAPSTFYRRPLPEACVPFSSAEGRRRFSSALAGGGCESYFVLSEHFTTQNHPAFCGLGSLVMVLNALALDPGRVWKGVWRWYHEELLDCCKPLDKVMETGITLPELQCLAACNGAKAELRHAKESAVGRGACCMDGTLDAFRRAVVETCGYVEGGEGDAGCGRKLIICSYSRKILGQTGSGHFSPVAAYDPESDSVLILDVARFKYPPHWVAIKTLHDAMCPVDPDTDLPRGWMLVSRPTKGQALASSMLLSVPTWDDNTSQAWNGLAGWLGARRAGGEGSEDAPGGGEEGIRPEETYACVSSHGGVLSILIENMRPKLLMNGKDAALLAIEELTSYPFFLAKTSREALQKRLCCGAEASAPSPCCAKASAASKGCCVGAQKNVTEAHLLTIVHEACVREQASWGLGDECESGGAAAITGEAAPLRAASGGGGMLNSAGDGPEEDEGEGMCVTVSGKELADVEVSAVRAKLRALPDGGATISQ